MEMTLPAGGSTWAACHCALDRLAPLGDIRLYDRGGRLKQPTPALRSRVAQGRYARVH
jgi:hypothetical protein